MKFPIYDRPISITTPTQTYHVSVWIDSSVLAFWKGNARQHTSRVDNLDSSLKNSSQPKNHELKECVCNQKWKTQTFSKLSYMVVWDWRPLAHLSSGLTLCDNTCSHHLFQDLQSNIKNLIYYFYAKMYTITTRGPFKKWPIRVLSQV